MTYSMGICDDCAEQVHLLISFLENCGEDGAFHLVHTNEPESFLGKG